MDGNDFLAVYAATQWAAERARGNFGATLIEHFTYRAEGHSTSDDPSRYRPTDEAKAWPLGDPIERLKQHLVVLGEWDEERHQAAHIRGGRTGRRRQQGSFEPRHAWRNKLPSVATMFEDVFKDVPEHLRRQRQQTGH